MLKPFTLSNTEEITKQIDSHTNCILDENENLTSKTYSLREIKRFIDIQILSDYKLTPQNKKNPMNKQLLCIWDVLPIETSSKIQSICFQSIFSLEKDLNDITQELMSRISIIEHESFFWRNLSETLFNILNHSQVNSPPVLTVLKILIKICESLEQVKDINVLVKFRILTSWIPYFFSILTNTVDENILNACITVLYKLLNQKIITINQSQIPNIFLVSLYNIDKISDFSVSLFLDFISLVFKVNRGCVNQNIEFLSKLTHFIFSSKKEVNYARIISIWYEIFSRKKFVTICEFYSGINFLLDFPESIDGKKDTKEKTDSVDIFYDSFIQEIKSMLKNEVLSFNTISKILKTIVVSQKGDYVIDTDILNFIQNNFSQNPFSVGFINVIIAIDSIPDYDVLHFYVDSILDVIIQNLLLEKKYELNSFYCISFLEVCLFKYPQLVLLRLEKVFNFLFDLLNEKEIGEEGELNTKKSYAAYVLSIFFKLYPNYEQIRLYVSENIEKIMETFFSLVKEEIKKPKNNISNNLCFCIYNLIENFSDIKQITLVKYGRFYLDVFDKVIEILLFENPQDKEHFFKDISFLYKIVITFMSKIDRISEKMIDDFMHVLSNMFDNSNGISVDIKNETTLKELSFTGMCVISIVSGSKFHKYIKPTVLKILDLIGGEGDTYLILKSLDFINILAINNFSDIEEYVPSLIKQMLDLIYNIIIEPNVLIQYLRSMKALLFKFEDKSLYHSRAVISLMKKLIFLESKAYTKNFGLKVIGEYDQIIMEICDFFKKKILLSKDNYIYEENLLDEIYQIIKSDSNSKKIYSRDFNQ